MALTLAEIALAEKLGECFTEFIGMERMHPAEPREFEFHIHALQHIVMARAAHRLHPERFPVR
jgi:hypothetical protein